MRLGKSPKEIRGQKKHFGAKNLGGGVPRYSKNLLLGEERKSDDAFGHAERSAIHALETEKSCIEDL